MMRKQSQHASSSSLRRGNNLLHSKGQSKPSSEYAAALGVFSNSTLTEICSIIQQDIINASPAAATTLDQPKPSLELDNTNQSQNTMNTPSSGINNELKESITESSARVNQSSSNNQPQKKNDGRDNTKERLMTIYQRCSQALHIIQETEKSPQFQQSKAANKHMQKVLQRGGSLIKPRLTSMASIGANSSSNNLSSSLGGGSRSTSAPPYMVKKRSHDHHHHQQQQKQQQQQLERERSLKRSYSKEGSSMPSMSGSGPLPSKMFHRSGSMMPLPDSSSSSSPSGVIAPPKAVLNFLANLNGTGNANNSAPGGGAGGSSIDEVSVSKSIRDDSVANSARKKRKIRPPADGKSSKISKMNERDSSQQNKRSKSPAPPKQASSNDKRLSISSNSSSRSSSRSSVSSELSKDDSDSTTKQDSSSSGRRTSSRRSANSNAAHSTMMASASLSASTDAIFFDVGDEFVFKSRVDDTWYRAVVREITYEISKSASPDMTREASTDQQSQGRVTRARRGIPNTTKSTTEIRYIVEYDNGEIEEDVIPDNVDTLDSEH